MKAKYLRVIAWLTFLALLAVSSTSAATAAPPTDAFSVGSDVLPATVLNPLLVVSETKLTAGDGAANDEFGRSVAMSGDAERVVVGASSDVGATSTRGRSTSSTVTRAGPTIGARWPN